MKEVKDSGSRFQALLDTYLTRGINALNDKEVLELMLCYSAPEKTAEALSDELIEEYEVLKKVFEAPASSFDNTQINSQSLVLLGMITPLSAYYRFAQNEKLKKDTVFDKPEIIVDMIFPYYIGKKEEQVVLMLLDDENKLLFCDIVFRGNISEADVNIRELNHLCIKYRAAGAVISHNHPSGVPIPSDNDINITKKIFASMRSVGTVLQEHIIFAENDYGLMSKMKRCRGCFGEP